ncbi:MAG TPA: cyclic nucleotide-binding domain-containing protein [Blastocatellia bacterium]|nr:cyclic nucleotide-binding domain-containing protein [Blastocatellia bacterium]
MSQQALPEESTSPRDILNAIRKVDCLSDLLSKTGEHFDYELDLEVIVYGRNYKGKPVGPYVKLLSYKPGTSIINEGDWADNDFYIVVDGQVDVLVNDIDGKEVKRKLGAGEQFGATSMLAGGPRKATVKGSMDRPVLLLKVQRPAVRLLRKLPKFAAKLDEVYREHGRERLLDELDDLIQKTGLDSGLRGDIRDIATFKVFSKNHVLFSEATSIGQLFYIAEGWVRRSRATGDGETRDFLGKGYCLGLEGARRNAFYSYTATVMGDTQVLEINVVQLRRKKKKLMEAITAALELFAPPNLQQTPGSGRVPISEKIKSSQESLIETGLADANNLLVMDMDLCVRCGNCSMACEKVHGRTRLVRRGIHITRLEPLKPKGFQSLLAPGVCMHCKDPECLTGCPTGAISRLAGGQIDIEPKVCIGCGDCATQCPYDAIFMVHRDEKKEAEPPQGNASIWTRLGLSSEPIPEPVTGIEDMLAIKCNLCSDRAGLNPPGSKSPAYSCEENCPTGALARIVPSRYFAEIGRIENLRMLDHKHAYGRNIHQRDSTKRWLHVIGISLFVLSAALTIAGLRVYGYGNPLPGLPNLRWITGIVGSMGSLGAAAYQLRRRVYDRRRWPLRYWMLAHYYLGVIACFIILLHGATFSGGWFTKALMVSFDVAVFTGLCGLALYQLVPRILTRIEGTPLLVEDLQARREELLTELSRISAGSQSSERLRQVINRSVLPRFDSFKATMREFVKQESFEELVDSAKREFQAIADTLDKGEERRAFDRALRAAVLLPRVKVLIQLHNLLRVWLLPHIVSVYVMLALMSVHIFQVVYASR